MSVLLTLAGLSTSCTKGSSDAPAPVVATPDVVIYSDGFQAQLAIEVEAEQRVPCPADVMVPDCSAWKRTVIDYGRMRDQARAAVGVE